MYQYTLRLIGLVFGTDDRALFSEGAPDYCGYVGMLSRESLRLFSTQLILTVMLLKHNAIEYNIFMWNYRILISQQYNKYLELGIGKHKDLLMQSRNLNVQL
jgi:hypothetical protein